MEDSAGRLFVSRRHFWGIPPPPLISGIIGLARNSPQNTSVKELRGQKARIYLTDRYFYAIFSAWKRHAPYRKQFNTLQTSRTAANLWSPSAGRMARCNAQSASLKR